MDYEWFLVGFGIGVLATLGVIFLRTGVSQMSDINQKAAFAIVVLSWTTVAAFVVLCTAVTLGYFQ